MKPKVAAGALVVLIVALAADTVAAQERTGFWFGIGGGYGSAKVTFDEIEGEDNDREGSGVANIRGGWTLNDRLLIGGEFNLWSKKAEFEPGVDATVNIYNALVTITAYTGSTSRFFVKGGAGASFLDVDFEMDGADITVDMGNGLGLLAGAGYDIPVSRRISVTPGVNFWYGRTGDMKFQGETLLSGGRHNVIDVTVGITFH